MSPKARRWLSAGYSVLALGALVWIAASRWEEVKALATGANYPALFGIAALAVVSPLLNAAFHYVSLEALGERLSFRQVVDASLRSLPARYLPGSLWYIGGRAALLRTRGVSTRAVTAAAVLEAVLSLATALVVGGLLILGPLASGTPVTLAVLAGGVLLVASGPVSNWLLRRRGGTPFSGGIRAWLKMQASMLAFWLWASGIFVLYLGAVGLATPSLRAAGTYMYSWAIGWIVPIAPQGLGVFEITATGMLPELGLVEGVLGLAGFRIVILLRDVLATLLGLGLRVPATDQVINDHL